MSLVDLSMSVKQAVLLLELFALSRQPWEVKAMPII